MIAGLPMYDPVEMHATVDAWWHGVGRAMRAEGIDHVPDRLDRGLTLDALWSASNLLLTQTCGFPLIGTWASHLRYLATPRYDAPGCAGGTYRSWIVVAANSPVRELEDLRGARCSINGRSSHSGFNALRALFAPMARDGRFFGVVGVSGGHAESLVQLQRGGADVAAIDCVTHALLRRCRPELIAATRIIGRTGSAPSLPYATRIDASTDLVQALRAALVRAFHDPELGTIRNELLLCGLDVLPGGSYASMAQMAAAAKRQNYFELD